MKPILTILLLCGSTALAQDVSQQDKLNYLEKQLVEKKSTRTLGAVVTLSGAVAGIAGAVCLGLVPDYSYSKTITTRLSAAGIGLLATGGVALTVGAIFWVLGAIRVAIYETKRDALMLSIVPTAGGGTVVASLDW